MMMLLPAVVNISGVVGKAWDATINLYADEAFAVPFDLSQYAGFEVDITDVGTLIVGDGLVVDEEAGLIIATLRPDQTLSLLDMTVHYSVSLINSDGSSDCPVHGDIQFEVS